MDTQALVPEIMDPATVMAELQPRYPGWVYKRDPKTGQRTLKPPPKPDQGMYESWAQGDRNRFNLRILRYVCDLMLYRKEQAAVFDTFQEGRDETYVSIEPTTQINQLCTMVSRAKPRIHYPFKTTKEQTDAQAMEDFSHHVLARWGQIHRSQTQGPLRWELCYYLALYGVGIVRAVPDPDDEEFPFKIDLIDPATCFWTPGDKWGLLRLTRVYREPIGKVLDAYDPDGRRKLRPKYTKHRNGQVVDDDKLVEIVEVWTRWHRWLSVDGMKVIDEAHEYGKVPFVVYLMPGEPGSVSAPETQPTMGPITEDAVRRGEWGPISTEQFDLAMKGQSFFAGFREAIRYEEKLFGLLMTQVKLDTYPPQITTTPYDDDPDPVDQRPMGHTRRRPGETTNPVQTNIRAQAIGPLATRLDKAQQKAGLPDSMFGLTEGSNISGFAENSKVEAAKNRIQPYYDAVQETLADVFELVNYLFHGFAHLYTSDPTSGELVVPRRVRDPLGVTKQKAPMPPFAQMATQGQGPMDLAGSIGMQPSGLLLPPGMPGAKTPPIEEDPPSVRISRETMLTVGFRPEVRLETISNQEFTSLVNALGIATDKQFVSTWRAMDRLGVDDPQLEQRMIDRELARKHPQMLERVTIPKSLWQSGDLNDFIAWTSFVMAQMAPQGMPGMGGPPGAPPGLPPGGPPPGSLPSRGIEGSPGGVRGVQTVQGDSQPSMAADGVPGRPRMPMDQQGGDVGP